MQNKKDHKQAIRKRRIEDNKKKQEENEKKNPFVGAGFSIACIVSSYYLVFNLEFFKYVWIAKTVIVLLLLLAVTMLTSTVNYYFKNKTELMYISFGVLLIPCNFMWYMLWPNFVTKIGAAIAFFLSIMFATIGFLRLVQKSILEIKQKANNNYTNVILVFVGEILALVLTIIQFIISFK